MENQTRFDLNAAIDNWRKELAALPNFSTDNSRELETHLRDTMAELRRCGLNEEESFWLARWRVGWPQTLAVEFAKADPARIWRERAFWVVFVLFLSNILINVIGVMAYDLQVVRRISDSGSFQMAQTVARELLFLSPVLIPLIIAMVVRSGKMSHMFSKLNFLIEDRGYLAIGLFGIIGGAAALVTAAATMHNARIHSLGLGLARLHLTVSIWQILYSTIFYPLAIALVLFLLVPSKNQRMPKQV